MAKLCLKKPSKRVPARRRYKIEKKVRDHNRKKRKEAKKNERKVKKKIIHCPNICPFKADILQTAEEHKKRKEEERRLAREAAKAERAAKKANNLEELVEDAQNKQIGLPVSPNTTPDEDESGLIFKRSSDGKQRTFYREFQKVVAAADIILEVVDSRDPLGTRCPQVEEMVRDSGENKRLVLVLNKADLITRENLDRWLKYLRRFVPTVAFKSSTQTQGKRLGRRKLQKGENVRSGAVCIGAEALTSLLGNYTRNKGVKTSIRVGVVGLPNVGKSSLINSLKRSRACQVGAVPGVTRSLQEVQLDSKIKLLDCPGLALASATDPHAALKNAVQKADAREAAEMILSRANPKDISQLYLVPEFKDATHFLSNLAKRFGKLAKGGVPDLQAAGQILLQDWNRGKIAYHTEPPEDSDPHISSAIVTANNIAEFDLASYDKASTNHESMDTASESQVSIGEGNYVVTAADSAKKKRKRNKESVKKKGESLMEAEGNLRMKKLNKVQMKKLRKQKKKNARNEADLTEGLIGISL